jgi:tryptophan-rich sensory protein
MPKTILNVKFKLPLLVVCLFSPLLLAECVKISSPNPAVVLQSLFLPIFQPPNWLFIFIWVILYLVMGFSLYMILITNKLNDHSKNVAVAYFFSQLALSYLWFIVFFAFQYRGLSVLIIAFLLALVIAVWKRLRAISAFTSRLWLLYIIWLSFAAILNYSIWIINL